VSAYYITLPLAGTVRCSSNTPTSYLEGISFEPQPEDWLSRPTFLWISSFPLANAVRESHSRLQLLHFMTSPNSSFIILMML